MAATVREERGEEDYILQRRASRENLPHGPLHRVQYETMIKKKLLYSLCYQYNSVSVARRLILLAGIFCYYEFSVEKKRNPFTCEGSFNIQR